MTAGNWTGHCQRQQKAQWSAASGPAKRASSNTHEVGCECTCEWGGSGNFQPKSTQGLRKSLLVPRRAAAGARRALIRDVSQQATEPEGLHVLIPYGALPRGT